MKPLIYLLLLFFIASCQRATTIQFAVCTDVHQDLMHDATHRLGSFIESAEENNAQFIIQLGDFCMPKPENKAFIETWDSFHGLRYHVLGNHDMDISDKVTTQKFWGMEKPYYSFDQGDFHFVVLDLNYYRDGEDIVPYGNGNYYSHPKERCYVPPGQLEWLKADLKNTNKLTIVFSHQGLCNADGAKNKEEVWHIFAEANHKKKKVIACFFGHDHSDTLNKIDGIHYIGLNSISYAWVGSKLEYSGRFTEEVEKAYPNLKYTLPYEKPVFAMVEINSKGTLTINGVESGFVKPGPEELGAENHNYTATISDRTLKF